MSGAVQQPIQIGAVSYLNARPLTRALDREPGRWHVRYDVPSVCATLLHSGRVDLGLIPSIEYLEGDDYRFVPGVAIGSRGPVASVALYTTRDVSDIRRIALDSSSRTSVALVKVLCTHRFHTAPEFVPHGPDLRAMLETCDAGLLIGDPALDVDQQAMGLRKIDLGAEWTTMTGLPFVYAAWTGRPGAIDASGITALQDARTEGVSAIDAIASEYARGNEAVRRRAVSYLRDNVRYGFGPEEAQGLQLFLDHAAGLGLAARRREIAFF